jgi:hypothetical protein
MSRPSPGISSGCIPVAHRPQIPIGDEVAPQSFLEKPSRNVMIPDPTCSLRPLNGPVHCTAPSEVGSAWVYAATAGCDATD